MAGPGSSIESGREGEAPSSYPLFRDELLLLVGQGEKRVSDSSQQSITFLWYKIV